MGYGQHSYGYDPENPPEPTLEDYCEMDGHQTNAHVDDQEGGSGYSYCHCGEYVSSPYGEPHDEYSAACANAVDAYVTELLRRTTSRYARNDDEAEYRKHRFQVGLNLRNKPLDYLLALRRSLSNSTARCLNEDVPNTALDEMDLFAALGVHVNNTGMDILHAAIRELRGEKTSGFEVDYMWMSRRAALFEVLSSPATLDRARIIARLIGELGPDNNGYFTEGETRNAVVRIAPHITKRPEAIPVAVAVFKEHGYTNAATDLILNVLEQRGLPPAALMDGAL